MASSFVKLKRMLEVNLPTAKDKYARWRERESCTGSIVKFHSCVGGLVINTLIRDKLTDDTNVNF